MGNGFQKNRATESVCLVRQRLLFIADLATLKKGEQNIFLDRVCRAVALI